MLNPFLLKPTLFELFLMLVKTHKVESSSPLPVTSNEQAVCLSRVFLLP